MKKIFAAIATVVLLTGCGNEPAPAVEDKPAQVQSTRKVDSTPSPTIPPVVVLEKPAVEEKPSPPVTEEKPSNKFEFRAEDLVLPETTILPPIPYTSPESYSPPPPPTSYTPPQNPMPRLNRDSNLSLDDFRQKFQTAAADLGAPEINIDQFTTDYHEGENVLRGFLSEKVGMEIVFNKDTSKVKSVWFSGNLSDNNDEELLTIAFVKTIKTFKPELTEAQVDSLLKNLSSSGRPVEIDSTKVMRSELSRDGMLYIISVTESGNFLWAAGTQ